MKTSKKLLALLLVAGVAAFAGLVSCSDDPVETPVKPEPPEEQKDTTSTKPDETEPVVDVPADGWPANYGGVMLQGFYWDSYDDTQWAVLEQQTDQFSGTFDLVWLPQSGYCGGQSMGYDDLYWFNNYNSSFGTEAQLRSLINTFKANGIKTIADVVINHRRNLSNWVDFPKETYKGVTYEMVSTDICANDDGGKTKTWATNNGFSLSANNDTGEGWDGMRDIDHKSQNVQTIVKAYLDFLKNDLGYAGFRYDMVKGYSASYTGQYNASAKPEFSVGECWDATSTIKNWIEGTSMNGVIQSAAFDFQFRYTVRNAMNNGAYNWLGQRNDNNWPLISPNQDAGKYRRYAVTFVENHDTEKRSNAAQDPLRRDTLAANAYMLAMPGTPCVFLKHWMAYPSEIKAMVAARKTAGITNQSSFSNIKSAGDSYVNIVNANNKEALLVAIGKAEGIDTQKWAKVVSGYHYAYYLPTSLETAYVDLPSGTYEGQQTATLSAVSSAQGAQLVYTTDGSTPTASSPSVASGFQLAIAVGTTTLKAGLLVGGKVSGIVSRTLVVKPKESDMPVEVPAFCTVGKDEVCAFFEAPSTWTQKIYCWAWNTTPAENFTSASGTWPGVVCKQLGQAANGHNVWKWTWDGTRQNKTSVKQPAMIIFSNNGSPQTDDLVFENGGYYTKDGLKAIVK